MINLTSKERIKLYDTLSSEQMTVLNFYHTETKRSIFFNCLFEEDENWIVQDLRVNESYGMSCEDEEKFYCDKCGRELKNQYIIVSVNNGAIHKLGISCLSQHLNISEAVAKEVHKRKLKIDEWLDDVLNNLSNHYQNEWFKTTYNQKDDVLLKSIFNTKELKLINDFIEVDLPLPTILQNRFEKFEEKNQKKQKADKELDGSLKHKRYLIDNVYQTLSEDKRNVLDKHMERNDEVLDISDYNDDYLLYDLYKKSNTKGNLYCDDCGAEIEYQYVVTSKDNDTMHKLGASCLRNLLDISRYEAMKYYEYTLYINDWLVDILNNIKEQDENEKIKDKYLSLEAVNINEKFEESEIRLISDFIKVSLPLPTDLQRKIIVYEEDMKRKQEIDKAKTLRNIGNSNVKDSLKNAHVNESKALLMAVASCRMNIWNKFKYKRNENERLTTEFVYGTKETKDKLLSYYTEQEAVQEIIKSVRKYHGLNIELEQGFFKQSK